VSATPIPERFVLMMPYRPLTDTERWLVGHVTMFGSDGYPVRKMKSGKWHWECRELHAPQFFKTRREAVAHFERYQDMLHDWLAWESYQRCITEHCPA